LITPEIFRAEILSLAKEIGVEVKEIHLRSMRRKWASCSSRGRLTFDPEILGKSDEDRLKTVIHELLHLRYPNHGRMFKRLLSSYMDRLGG